MRSRLTADVLLLGALLVVTLGIAIYAVQSGRTQEEESEIMARRTTFKGGQGGYKALYEILEQLDYPVRRWHSSFEELEEPGTLIVAEPEPGTPVTLGEWRAAAEWVRRGNLLIYLSDEGETFSVRPGFADLINAPVRTSRPVQPTALARAAPELRTRSGFRLDQTEWTPFGTWGTGEEATGGRGDGGTGRPGRGSSFRGSATEAPLVPLYRDEQGATVAYARWGRGTVIASSSAWSFSTAGLRQEDNLAFLLAAIAAYGPKSGVQAFKRSGVGEGSPARPNARTPERPNAIWFDEYHHGYGEKRGVVSLLAPVARLGLAQLVIAWLLLTYTVSRRFGGRVPDEDQVRRSRSEYLGSMASLLHRARAVDLAMTQVRRQFLHDATRALGLPRDASQRALLAAAATRGVDPDRLRSLLERAERLTRERDRTKQEEAVAVARELARIRNQL